MKADTVRIPYKYGQEFKLIPLFDIHLGNKSCDKRKLKEDIKKAEDTENLFIVGGGDWLDSIIVTDKRYRKSADDTDSEAIIDDQIDTLAEILDPVKHKILCAGDGNHELTLIKHGTNPVKRLCEKLSTPEHEVIYFGESWMLKLMFHEDGQRGRSLTIYCHHGWGGGSRTQGADITKYSHAVKFWDADLFLFGHTHKVKADIVEVGRMIGNNSWKTFQKKTLVCGTYQRTYSQDTTTTWAESKGFNPTTIGNPYAILKPHHEAGVGIKLVM